MNVVAHGQGLATEGATAWREMAAPGEAWLKHRTRERGLMTLVLRCWRERVEHDAAGISHDSTRWRVRREPRQHARQGRRQQRRAPDGSDEKQFQTTQLINLVDFATRFKWSPWRDIQPRVTTEEADDPTDMTQLRRWRLKCDLMRVATYYRVTGAQMRVDARKRSARTRTRFREWAASVRRERAAATRPSAETEGENGQRASRKRPMQTGSYSEARTYTGSCHGVRGVCYRYDITPTDWAKTDVTMRFYVENHH